MKFTVSSSALLKQLQNLSGVISTNNALPILESFLFEVNKKKLVASASDMETAIITNMELIDSSGGGFICIPAKILLETLKTFPEQPLTFDINEKLFSVEITTENGKYKLTGYDGNEFPKMPEVESPSSFEIEASVLLTIINKTLFAAGTDELRPAMCGVNFLLKGEEGITFASTDAHKLARYKKADIKTNGNASYTVPKKALGIIKSIAPDGNIKVSYNDTNVSFAFGDTVIYSRLIDAKYPNYEAVIPKNNNKKIEIDRDGFLNSIRRVSVFSNRATNQIRLEMKSGKKNIKINAEDLDFANEASEKISCEYAGDDLTIGFNAKFITEVLSALDTQKVIVEFNSPNTAAIIKPQGDEDLLALVMPFMLNN